MEPMFLSQAELAELSGRKLKAGQVAWLKANKYLYEINANGHPKVSRQYVQLRLGGAAASQAARLSSEPDFGALDR